MNDTKANEITRGTVIPRQESPMKQQIEQGHIETIKRTAYTSDGHAMWQMEKDIYPSVTGKETLRPYNALMREIIMKNSPPEAMDIPLDIWGGDETIRIRFVHAEDAGGKRLAILASTSDRKMACVDVLMFVADKATRHFATLMNEVERQVRYANVANTFAAELKSRGFC